MQVSLHTLKNNPLNYLGLQSFLTDVNFRSHKTRIALRGNNKPHIDWRSFWVPVSMITTPFSNSSSPNFCASAWQIPKTSKLPVKALSYCSLVRISGKLVYPKRTTMKVSLLTIERYPPQGEEAELLHPSHHPLWASSVLATCFEQTTILLGVPVY